MVRKQVRGVGMVEVPGTVAFRCHAVTVTQATARGIAQVYQRWGKAVHAAGLDSAIVSLVS